MEKRTILTMKGIVKQYMVGGEVSTVLKGIDLTVEEGEFLAVLGPSGSGKSTLMNIIGCLDVPTAGEYILDGRPIGSQDEKTLAKIRNQEIGFIFQSFFLMQRQTALQNVKLPLIYGDVPEREQNERAAEMLRRVGLEDKMNYYPNQLSGGQQQRVAIARAMCNNPAILLADEPTGALDQKTGRQVMELFHKINDEGKTIIMITHDANIAAHAKRIVRILDGNIGKEIRRMHSMGIIRQSIQLSWENIKSNKMRTFLTTLGIIIGVTAVISLITIVNGVIATVMNEFASLGAGTISVSISGTPLKRGLTESDLESLEALDNVAGVSPTISSTGMAARNQKLLDSVSIQGKNEVYYAHNSQVTVGRGISEWDVENSAYVCVIDQDIADKLFAGENPVGQTLTVSGTTYTVIGLEGQNDDLMASMSGFGSNYDGTITIP